MKFESKIYDSRLNLFKKMFIDNGFTYKELSEIEGSGYFDNIEFKKKGIIVYRSVSLPKHQVFEFMKLKENGIGEYWTLRSDLGSVWGGNAEYEIKTTDEKIYNIRCKGFLSYENIYWAMMRSAFDDDFYNFTDEKEIRGKNSGDSVEIIDCVIY